MNIWKRKSLLGRQEIKMEKVCLHEHKPQKGVILWFSRECYQFAEINDCILQNVKWKDEEPTKNRINN